MKPLVLLLIVAVQASVHSKRSAIRRVRGKSQRSTKIHSGQYISRSSPTDVVIGEDTPFG